MKNRRLKMEAKMSGWDSLRTSPKKMLDMFKQGLQQTWEGAAQAHQTG